VSRISVLVDILREGIDAKATDEWFHQVANWIEPYAEADLRDALAKRVIQLP
jgi:hypothetical protein